MTRRAATLDRRAPSAVQGIRIARRHTAPGQDPLDAVEWEKRSSVIAGAGGEDVFRMNEVEAPRFWSQLSTDIAASKYLRKTGVPGAGAETGVRQLFERVAKTVREAGEGFGYFASTADAQSFEDELKYLLVHQIGAFNSPVFFNVGLFHRYGITGTGGNWHYDSKTERLVQIDNAYARPQASACFIQSLDDHLTSIFELAKNEARIFKYGSGSGTNFSRVRSKYERISGGGTASGLMFFLEVLDKGAGAIKSGGVARRAAKMVVLDVDHPEIEDFIQWKSREEKKVAVLIAAGYPSDFNGEAYRTVSGQNSNNSVRVGDGFMQAALTGGKWSTRERTSGRPLQEFEARRLLNTISQAAWACADPGLQFDDTINGWHTCLETERIRASNPCSEFMFLDDTACNLASLNLLKFRQEGGGFDVKGFRHAARVFFVAQEILVEFSSYPTPRIAQNSYDYRPLGLGYANLGALLMMSGLPYDSAEARAVAGAVTAMLTGHAYAVSAELAAVKGPFAGFEKNRAVMLGVMEKHRASVERIDARLCPPALLAAAREDWNAALAGGRAHGYRNSQATVLAPTGTIGLLMGCDTTGVEPEFALVKIKKLAGGGALRIANESVGAALGRLGYPASQVEAVLEHVSRAGAVEGAPGLKPEHLAVFDCANPPATGGRCIEPMGHVRMMAAVQPFISGAISKTVNLPHETTVQDIERIYVESWKLGLKAISVYRDGCKLSQPLSAAKAEKAPEKAAGPARFDRESLPQRRAGFTQELRLGGQKFYLRTGEYEDGRLGEVFLDGGKPGSPLRGMLCAWATTLSLALQYGTPPAELLDRLTFIRFEPSGPVQHPLVKQASSIIDLAARLLSIEYLGRTDLAHVKPAKRGKAKAKAAAARPPVPNAIDQELGRLMGDAPMCDTCGYLTVRNGTCYKCVNCGQSMGCS